MESLVDDPNTSYFETATSRWISDHAPTGILVTDTSLTIRYCNKWVVKQTGKKEDDIVGHRLLSVFPEIEMRGLAHYYRAALKGESHVLSFRLHKYLLQMPVNRGAPLVDQMQQSCRIAPLLDGEIVTGTITIIEDVTERTARERELRSQLGERERLLASELEARRLAEENSRLKDEFLATVSHEIRAPLNAIRGWTLILRGGSVDKETFDHALDTIDRNVVSQSQVIEDLLDISRMVTGQMKLEFRPVDLCESIESALDDLSPAAVTKEIRLIKTISPAASIVSGDGDRIRQILWNLISNAIKFTPAKGTVEVILHGDEDFAEVTVRDNGSGIPPEFQPFVFDRFRQADGGMKRRHGGLGLGLSIVKSLVEMHGGTVSVESGGEGAGTAFSVRIPRLLGRRDDEISEMADSFSNSAQPLKMLNCRIMIVDDDDDSREMLRILLSTRNAEVLAAGSAWEALAHFETFNPDIVISDLGMPEMDGYDLIRQIRTSLSKELSNVPAIALTGYVSADEQKRVKASGFDAHLSKPLDQTILVQTISDLLGGISR